MPHENFRWGTSMAQQRSVGMKKTLQKSQGRKLHKKCVCFHFHTYCPTRGENGVLFSSFLGFSQTYSHYKRKQKKENTHLIVFHYKEIEN